MKTKDIAWLAGILEGEGCFTICKSNTCPVIRMGSVDKDVVERVAKLLDSNVSFKLIESGRFYNTNIAGKRAIQWMMTVYPLMGKRRQIRIKHILALWKAHVPIVRDRIGAYEKGRTTREKTIEISRIAKANTLRIVREILNGRIST